MMAPQRVRSPRVAQQHQTAHTPSALGSAPGDLSLRSGWLSFGGAPGAIGAGGAPAGGAAVGASAGGESISMKSPLTSMQRLSAKMPRV